MDDLHVSPSTFDPRVRTQRATRNRDGRRIVAAKAIDRSREKMPVDPFLAAVPLPPTRHGSSGAL